MNTADAAPTTQDAAPTIDPDAVQAFAGRMFGVLSSGSTALMTSIGHRVGLFDTLSTLPPSGSHRIAEAAGLSERYVREWLGGMTMAEVVEHDPATDTYRLPPEHAAVLTREAGPDNLADIMQFVPLLSQVEEPVIECFRHGGGVPYAAYERFHGLMAELSSVVHDASLIDVTLPLAGGVPQRLAEGCRVADVGCGQGHAINLMGRAFPASEFVGYDFEAQAIDVARRDAAEWGLENVRFEVRDVTDLSGQGPFDLITAFDAIHDQAYPALVLDNVATQLAPDGTFLMVDMRASSVLDENHEIPWAPFLYAVSTMHCMTVSLSLGGDGLGTAWGEQTARRMLADAGFSDVRVEQVEGDFINNYYVCRRGSR